MADHTGTLERIAIELANALLQVPARLRGSQLPQTLTELGIGFPGPIPDGVVAAGDTAATVAEAVPDTLAELISAIEGGDDLRIVERGIELVARCGLVINGFVALGNGLSAAGVSVPPDFGQRLFELFVVDHVDGLPTAGNVLTLLGGIERIEHAGAPGDPTRPEFTERRIHWQRILAVITDPATHLRTLYDWGAPGFTGDKLLTALHDFIARQGLPALLHPPSDGRPMRLEAFAFDLTPDTTLSPPGLAVDVVFPVGGDIDVTIPLPHPAWTAHVKFEGQLLVGTSGTLRPPAQLDLQPPEGDLKGQVIVAVQGAPASPFVLQLGYGFTLLGVGGIIGLNRTMRLDALAEGVRTGAIESVMFPHDVVANAPRILSDLKAFFPPQQGTFLIGPMAKIGWGTPTLISVAVGVIIEIPGNIAIVGVIKVALPTEDEAILLLQVNFIGAIEFDRKRIWFFASLFESRVLTLTIDGELGVLVAYGDEPNLVLTVGGFHPAYAPPPLPFPTPRRVAINILNTDNARIGVSGYFAVTSNTAQFGAAAELYFGFSAFSVQGHIGFDALFRFSPFSFIIEVSASVSLKAFGVGLFSISLRFSLEGPTPWRARGTLDVQHPGAGLPGIANPELGGVLRLGGALKVPDTALGPPDSPEAQEAAKYENWDQPFPHPFQQALAALINLSDDYAAEPALAAHGKAVAAGVTAVTPDDPDPMVTPPLYGRWPALTSRLLTGRDGTPIQPNDNWVHELNLDPRFRIAAGIGARVVREHQEEFMAAAWAQLGDVLEANRRIRAAQLAREVGYAFHTRHLQPLMATAPAQALAVTAPLHTRVTTSIASAATTRAATAGTRRLTVAAQLADSRIAGAPLSPPMRRVTRPGSRLMRGLPFDPEKPRHALLERVNRGEVTAAPPKTRPAGVVTVDQLEAALRERPDAPAPKALSPEPATIPDPVADLPQSPSFVVSLPGEDVHPEAGDTDSPEAIRFKAGLRDAYAAFNVAEQAGQVPPREQTDLGALAGATLDGLHPDVTVPRRVLGGLALPERFQPQADRFVEAMAYPVIDLPMYRPLLEMSRELFLPNLNLVPPNSITLLEANQRFIESYLVGLNHEMARELLWREYPTDQRGSPFRQFWDTRSVLPKPDEDPDVLRERLRDIPPLHRWKTSDALGDHDARDQDGGANLVLVIRGELLKKYPTAVIYAHRAEWHRKADGTPDPAQERFRAPLTPGEELDPPGDKVRLPVYDAKVDPDIYFLGFDLTEEDARGGTGVPPDDDPGWFFIIKERPGDPRFGLDLERAGALQVWNDLAWPDVLPASPPSSGPTYLQLGPGTPSLTLTEPTDPADQEKFDQYAEDKFLTWNPQMSASDAAYILYQAPVLVAVHAREMLDHE